MDHKIKENKEKIKLNNQLPYLVGNVVEVLDMDPEEDEDGAAVDLDSQRRGKAVVLKTSTRQTVFLPVIGLVDAKVCPSPDQQPTEGGPPASFSKHFFASWARVPPRLGHSGLKGAARALHGTVLAVILCAPATPPRRTCGPETWSA